MCDLPVTLCRLCGKEAELQNSHIIPKFVFRWQKETSPTGVLRRSDAINRRVQDGFTEKMLCKACELELSKHENIFKNEIFDPSTCKASISLSYKSWFSRFATSVVWRALHFKTSQIAINALNDFERAEISKASQTWADFLTYKRSDYGRFPLHFLDVWQLQSVNHEQLPGNWNRFINRHSSIQIFHNQPSTRLTIYVKMGPVAIFSHIIPPNKKWFGTRVNANIGTYNSNSVKVPHDLLFALMRDAYHHLDFAASASEEQHKVIRASFLGNIERVMSSRASVEMMADIARFGDKAFVPDKIS